MEQENQTRTMALGELSRTDFVKFAGAGGDFNPVHHDEDHARAAGHPSVFAMGLLTAGLASRFITDWVGVAAVRSFEVRFKNMVWPMEALTAQGRVVERIEGVESHVRIAFEVVNDVGEVKLSGTADVMATALTAVSRG